MENTGAAYPAALGDGAHRRSVKPALHHDVAGRIDDLLTPRQPGRIVTPGTSAGGGHDYAAPGVTRYASNTESMLRRRVIAPLRACVSGTSTTNRFWTIGLETVQRAS